MHPFIPMYILPERSELAPSKLETHKTVAADDVHIIYRLQYLTITYTDYNTLQSHIPTTIPYNQIYRRQYLTVPITATALCVETSNIQFRRNTWNPEDTEETGIKIWASSELERRAHHRPSLHPEEAAEQQHSRFLTKRHGR